MKEKNYEDNKELKKKEREREGRRKRKIQACRSEFEQQMTINYKPTQAT